MKKILLLTALVLSFWGCNNGEDPANEINDPKEYMISFGFSGEITDIINSPLPKTVSTDLYGIQIYSMPAKGGTYTPYAYGLFDDISAISIKLLEGYTYKFVCTMVIDGKKKIQHSYVYYDPFYISNEGNGYFSSIENKFTIGKGYFYSIDKGGTNLAKDSKSYDRPNTDRYYGEISNYTPSDNSSVSINMTRVSFGAKVIAEGLTEGKITISLEKAPAITITYPKTETEDIFTFKNPYPHGIQWTGSAYTETIPVSITWEKADGVIVPLATQNVTFTRNILTTITIKVSDNTINNGINITQDKTEMKKGENITINAGSNTETPIIPGQQ